MASGRYKKHTLLFCLIAGLGRRSGRAAEDRLASSACISLASCITPAVRCALVNIKDDLQAEV